jgi:hypothetical protein
MPRTTASRTPVMSLDEHPGDLETLKMVDLLRAPTQRPILTEIAPAPRPSPTENAPVPWPRMAAVVAVLLKKATPHPETFRTILDMYRKVRGVSDPVCRKLRALYSNWLTQNFDCESPEGREVCESDPDLVNSWLVDRTVRLQEALILRMKVALGEAPAEALAGASAEAQPSAETQPSAEAPTEH